MEQQIKQLFNQTSSDFFIGKNNLSGVTLIKRNHTYQYMLGRTILPYEFVLESEHNIIEEINNNFNKEYIKNTINTKIDNITKEIKNSDNYQQLAIHLNIMKNKYDDCRYKELINEQQLFYNKIAELKYKIHELEILEKCILLF